MDHKQLDRSTSGIQVITRAMDILRALKQDTSGLSLGQIAEKVHLPRSTVQRIVNALLAERMVMTTSAEGGLRLGPEIQSLAAAGRVEMSELVRPALISLSARTSETVDLSVFRGGRMVFVDQVVGTQRLRAVSAVGETFPVTSTANGKAALALMDDAEVAAIATEELKSSGPHTRPFSAVMKEIEEIRSTGIAWDLDEHTDGICAAGFAFQSTPGPIYAISVPVPSFRFGQLKNDLPDLLGETRASVLKHL
ncbi:IclR family transcriptional regulator [Roseibium sp. RKSG952]|uniref:IclR family transcriptional regulator n=1 Tax=Roseibium sp. RKSG952 TaxID=2529384 RepID=UPI0012BB904D|nr:IclR family transcriptional regulator [Roseibium sp. RKSG952]MTH99098.1 IclR family transcriptional regulator [Roseibium sp. RKSG952]